MSYNLHQCIGGTVLVMACLVQGAQATNLGVFSDTPYSYFNEKDRSIFHDTLDKALNGAKDNELSRWSNPKTGSAGEITPVRQFQYSGRDCREVKIVNQSHGRRNQSLQVFCKQPDGSWKWEMVNVK